MQYMFKILVVPGNKDVYADDVIPTIKYEKVRENNLHTFSFFHFFISSNGTLAMTDVV